MEMYGWVISGVITIVLMILAMRTSTRRGKQRPEKRLAVQGWGKYFSTNERLLTIVSWLYTNLNKYLVKLSLICDEPANWPPGPWMWPVIGHLHMLVGRLPHRALAEVSKQHGHVVGLRLGLLRTVVVSSPEAARQVLLTHDKLFTDRPPLLFSSLLLFGEQNGVAFNRLGPRWRYHRKLCTLHLFTAKRLHHLRHVRQQELRSLLLSIHSLSCAGTAPVDLGQCVGQMSSRIMMRLVYSKPIVQVGNENLHHLIKEAEQELVPTIGDLIPPLSLLDFFRKKSMHRIHGRLDKVLTGMLMERKETASPCDDLLQGLLSEQDGLSLDETKGILFDIMAGGIHTTALSLEWAMAELLRNPHCLHRLRKEIEEVMGEKKEVSEDDLPKLSYLQWVVKEVLRLHPLATLLSPRYSTEECELQGYIIPAKTVIFVNVWAIGRDEQLWENANEFMPERFEGKDLDVKGQHFELLPFGSGRRICVGMPLSLPVVEVTLANLVVCFDWELPYGETHTSINMDEKSGLSNNKATPVIVIPKMHESSLKILAL